MVDALRRAHRMVKPDGFVLDIHPSADAPVEAGDTVIGHVEAPDAKRRHGAADVALASIVDDGLFTIDRTTSFRFYTYGDSIEELRDYIEENWRDSRIDARTVDLTREALSRKPGARPRVCEHVKVTRLLPHYA